MSNQLNHINIWDAYSFKTFMLDVESHTRKHCSILKSSMLVKCHFGRQNLFGLILGHFTTMLCKLPPFTVKASLNIVCHKTQWLQFVNRNIVGLQSWHSGIHFQIPTTPAISTLQLRPGVHNYIYGNIIFPNTIGRRVIA